MECLKREVLKQIIKIRKLILITIIIKWFIVKRNLEKWNSY